MLPVILSGGNGSRLWPLSRTAYPKQFLPLTGEATMLQMTIGRVTDIDHAEPPLVVCNDIHRFLVAEQLRSIGVSPFGILLEPVARNTAPAVAAAALTAAERDPDELLLVLPADHLIPDEESFRRAVQTARGAALDGDLVTFGVIPRTAETGFGYIRAERGTGPVRVQEFVEKPDRATAERYLESGDYYWNSGMFLFRASRLLQEFERFEPDLLDSCQQACEAAQRDLDFVRLEEEAFSRCPMLSIDNAIMERTERAVMLPLDAGWSDLGSWSALHDAAPLDDSGNSLQGDVISEDTRNCYVRSEGRLIATVGLRDCIVVETPDAVLVADRNRSQDVKKVVDRLKAEGRDECDFHKRIYRPWGHFEGVTQADRFQVKHIVVNPGCALSLQMHHHRAEHWVVVRGTARVVCGDESRLVGEDQSTYIPLGTIHRLENPGVIPLELIEVQTGSYLGEDDIIRYHDHYSRN